MGFLNIALNMVPINRPTRNMVDINQGFRYHYEPELADEAELNMFYDGGWIYLVNDQRDGRIYRYHQDGIHDSIIEAIRNQDINEPEANQYLELLAMIREGCRFPREFFLYSFDYDIMYTLDTWIMLYGSNRERVAEMPIDLFLGDGSSIGTISIVDPCAIDEFEFSLSDDEIWVQPDTIVMDMFHMAFDLETEESTIDGFDYEFY
jgi:hypothetical protein